MNKKHVLLIIAMILLLALSYYVYTHIVKSHNKVSNATHHVIHRPVKAQKITTNLFFSGTIASLHTHNVTTPIAGTIAKVGFEYGQQVNLHQFLVEINSSESEKAYREALTTYLKAKDTYINSRSKLISQKQLYKDGLIARNDYQSAYSEFENNQLAYRQAIYTLKSNIAKVTPQKTEQQKLYHSLTNLALGDKKVDQALSLQLSNITLYAKNAGVALFPQKSSDDANNNNISVGSVVKAGQVVASIGDLTGLSMAINVNEMSINKIKLGQKAIITGAAFPNLHLQGYVASIGIEAQNDNDGSLPTFPVKIIVPKLTTAMRHIIHIGMSAQVKLLLSNPKQIMVAINAVQQTNHGNYITVMRNGSKKTIAVTTGLTTQTQVAITSGLQPGDNIVLPH